MDLQNFSVIPDRFVLDTFAKFSLDSDFVNMLCLCVETRGGVGEGNTFKKEKGNSNPGSLCDGPYVFLQEI